MARTVRGLLGATLIFALGSGYGCSSDDEESGTSPVDGPIVSCNDNGDCMPPVPYCGAGLYCVECLADDNCSGMGPGGGNELACNLSTGSCVQCTSDDYCSGAQPYCELGSNRCVECLTTANCGDANLACDPATHACVSTCTTNADCTAANPQPGFDATPECDPTKGYCVECTEDSHCTNDNLSVCAATGQCVQCVDDSTCGGNAPYCVLAENRCVECLSDANCTGAGQVCNDGRCGCTTGYDWCGDACINTQTDPENCGECGRACEVDQTCTGGQCQGG